MNKFSSNKDIGTLVLVNRHTHIHINTHKHTRIHTQRETESEIERQRVRERERAREYVYMGYVTINFSSLLSPSMHNTPKLSPSVVPFPSPLTSNRIPFSKILTAYEYMPFSQRWCSKVMIFRWRILITF